MELTPPQSQFHRLTEETEIEHVTYSLSKDNQHVVYYRVSHGRGSVQRQGELIKNKMRKIRVDSEAKVRA